MRRKRLDTKKLKTSIAENTDLMIDLLNELEMKNPHWISHYQIQCGWTLSSSGKSTLIEFVEDNVTFYRFSTGEGGDIITLVQKKLDRSFIEAIKFIQKFYSGDFTTTKEGNTKRMSELDRLLYVKKSPEPRYEILDDNILGEYQPSKLFLADGILLSTQYKFHIWHEYFSDRICLNWRDYNGFLIGSIGRLDQRKVFADQQKYLPTLINFKKGDHIFGIDINKEHIKKAKKIVIFEAEKSVMQAYSMGFRLCGAVGHAFMSVNQLKVLQYLGVKDIFFAFDEGLENTEEIVRKLKTLIDTNGFDFQAHCIIDKNNSIMTKYSKNSPSDLGEQRMYKIFRDKRRKLYE